METVYLVIAFIMLIGSSVQQINYQINRGASTSRGEPRLEECELNNIAQRLVQLLLAEDIEGTDLVSMARHRFHELEAFYNEVMSSLLLAERGAQFITDFSRRTERLGYFTMSVNEIIRGTILRTCQDHYQQRLYIRFSKQHDFDSRKCQLFFWRMFMWE